MSECRTILSLPIADIGELPADQYVGLIDDHAIACLEARLPMEGLRTPIWVRRNGNAAKKPWSVIAGRHRLIAATRLNWPHIDAVQQADASSSADELRNLQVTENLDRRVLRPVERAINIMFRWQNVAKDRSWDIVSHAREADRETALACGGDERTIRRYRRLHETIVGPFPDLYAALNAHPLGESLSGMTRIAQIESAPARRKVIETIIADHDNALATIDAALTAAKVSTSKGSRAAATAAPYNGFLGAFTRMPASEQKVAATKFAAAVPPEIAKEMIAAFIKRGISL